MKKVLLTILTVIVVGILGLGAWVKFALPNVGPAPELKVEITPERVAHGEYLANHVTVCMDCHSTRDWNVFSAPIKPGTLGKGGEFFGEQAGFPGSFYSKNITPYHLKNWTDGEIFRAITTGVSKDGSALFPVMPYSYYGRMDKEDIYDIIAYIRSLKPIANTTPEHTVNFPVNFLLNTIPEKAHLTKRPTVSDTLAYGAYMVNASGCRECHTPAKDGQIIESKAFTGGRVFDFPNLTVYSANLTPDIETGIGSWTSGQFISRFKAYSDPATLPAVSSNGNQTVMPWSMYAGMDSTDLLAIFKYLMSLKPVKNNIKNHFVVHQSGK